MLPKPEGDKVHGGVHQLVLHSLLRPGLAHPREPKRVKHERVRIPRVVAVCNDRGGGDQGTLRDARPVGECNVFHSFAEEVHCVGAGKRQRSRPCVHAQRKRDARRAPSASRIDSLKKLSSLRILPSESLLHPSSLTIPSISSRSGCIYCVFAARLYSACVNAYICVTDQ